jgi:hypothetical protein
MRNVSEVIASSGDVDANLPARFERELSLGGKPVTLTIGAFDAQTQPLEHLGEIFLRRSNTKTANVVILDRCGAEIIGAISQMGIVDCVVCPPESDEAELLGGGKGKPLVVTVGRLGKYVGRLGIKVDESTGELIYSYSTVAVREDIKAEPVLVELYKTYQQIVKLENLLENQLRFPLPDGLEYTGSKSCKLCHEYEYDKWSTKAHAGAYATLERVGSQYDPECVICHVVGLEYDSGFVSEQETPNLKDVGCENCHGPGSEHIRTLGNAGTTEPQSGCTDCHTPDHSADYAGNEAAYLQKIVHWREPNAVGDVKR